MCIQFTKLFLLVSSGLVFHAECSLGKHTTPAPVNCTALGGLRRVDIVNSPYTVLPNDSLCCPRLASCKEKSVMREICRNRELVDEPCFQCKTCAKMIGETCSGPHGMYGECESPLICIGSNGSTLPYGEAIGACTTAKGRRIRNLGKKCGGRFDSIGLCVSDCTCRKDYNTDKGICVKCAKTKQLNETCGGQYGSLGLCDTGLKCSVREDDFLNGTNVSGYCNRIVCFKNCSKRNDSLVCGGTRDNENRWYRNICFLRKENCPFQYTKFLKKSDSECGSNATILPLVPAQEKDAEEPDAEEPEEEESE